uniref:hypothetical protein n=1 Tax=Streptomyces sp. JV181 TaxID=858635 RepID=UPI002E78482B|nr:hypothetical protein [Streptomyces sp. JV181]
MNTRRLIDAGVFTPPPASPDGPASQQAVCRPARPIVQLLYLRYLASRPVEEIQCVAQTRRRDRCTSPLLTPGAPAGAWALVPATASSGQLALPARAMAVYDLNRVPVRRAAALARAALPAARRRTYGRRRGGGRLGALRPAAPPRAHPHPPAHHYPTPPACGPRTAGGPAVTSHHAVEILLTQPAAPGELRQARCGVRLAASADRTRLMAVCSALSPSGALYALRRQLGARLPIHVLTTHYPDRHGQVLSTSPWTTPPWGPCARLRPSWGSVPRSCCGGG